MLSKHVDSLKQIVELLEISRFLVEQLCGCSIM